MSETTRRDFLAMAGGLALVPLIAKPTEREIDAIEKTFIDAIPEVTQDTFVTPNKLAMNEIFLTVKRRDGRSYSARGFASHVDIHWSDAIHEMSSRDGGWIGTVHGKPAANVTLEMIVQDHILSELL